MIADHRSDHLLQRCVCVVQAVSIQRVTFHRSIQNAFLKLEKMLEACSDGNINQALLCFLPTGNDQIPQQLLHFWMRHADWLTFQSKKRIQFHSICHQQGMWLNSDLHIKHLIKNCIENRNRKCLDKDGKLELSGSDNISYFIR